jgi:hypothetical protein
MIVTYLRSSSYSTHSMCPHKFYLTYILGERELVNKKAQKGTITHKALETLARVKKAQQDGLTSYDDEAFGHVDIGDVTPEWAARRAYDYYTRLAPHHEWLSYDLKDCIAWTNKAISINNGMFDPRLRRIVEAEKKFDFVIDKPWAYYKYEVDGEVVEGQLGLKGTMDLVVEDDPGLIEVIDWKTGKRTDWAKIQENTKTYIDLRYDPQLCLYHYAANHLYPEAEEIFLTIIYINSGGPFTLCFEHSDLELTERIIRRKFDIIRETTRPELVKTWKCSKFCYFGMNRSKHDPNKTICQFYADEVRKNGIEETMKKYGRKGAFNEYGEGGGRKESPACSD